MKIPFQRVLCPLCGELLLRRCGNYDSIETKCRKCKKIILFVGDMNQPVKGSMTADYVIEKKA